MTETTQVEDDRRGHPDGSGQESEDHWEEVHPAEVTGETAPISPARAKIWSLVLKARGLPHRLRPREAGWRLWVRRPEKAVAEEQLRLYEAENRHWPPPPPPAPKPGGGHALVSLSALLCLGVFYNLTRLTHVGTIDWMAAGSASAEKILDGQWWRPLTALTLHADGPHLAGNLLIGAVFVLLLCRELGSGAGWFLLLLAGVLGNVTNAVIQPPRHDAVGFSTALFGAIGLLVGLGFPANRPRPRAGRLFTLAAGVVLLAMLGTGDQRTDIGAHLFGFVWGVLLGAGAGAWVGADDRPAATVNALLGAAAALAPAVAWAVALLAAKGG